MKNSLLFYLLCFGVFAGLEAQDTRKWYVGVSISPDLCYRELSNPSDDQANTRTINSRNRTEQFKLGFTAGVNVKRKLNSKFSLETGLLYSSKGYILHIEHIVFTTQANPDGTGDSDLKLHYNYKYLDLPLKLNASLAQEERYAFYITAGAALNFFLEQENVSVVKLQDGGKEVAKSKGDPYYSNAKLNISPFVGFGFHYRMGKRLQLQVEPLFRYGILPSTDSKIVNQYLWNCGLNTVLYYAL